MSADVVSSSTIARPRAEAAAHACDPDHATNRYANSESVAWEPPLAVGARLGFVAASPCRAIARANRADPRRLKNILETD